MPKAALKNVTILDLLFAITKRYENVPALKMDERVLTYDDLREQSVNISCALIKLEVAPDSRCAILLESRPEWAVAYFGIVSAAGITVPMDVKLSETEMLFVLNDSEAVCVFTSAHYMDFILRRRQELPYLKHIFCFDRIEDPQVIDVKTLTSFYEEVRNRPLEVTPDDTALIVYTSGTTGIAKGVMISYRNLLFEVQALSGLVQFSTKDHFISILPLNHLLEITGGLIAPLYGGACVTYCSSLKATSIMKLMQENQATGMFCVPLILKMFHSGIFKQVEKLPPGGQKLFHRLLQISKYLNRHGIPFGKIFFRKIHQNFGGHLKCFICGGAPLEREVEEDFAALGFVILQGYGLTETSPVIAVNSFRHRQIGSVGRPLPGVEVKILKTEDTQGQGEIVVRGPNVMKGYDKRPDLTAEVIKDGWFRTGDLGYFDKDGFLFISGRIKNLIVLGGGKKIFPEEVEEVMMKSPFLKEICVLGRTATQGLRKGSEEVYAVIVPDWDRFSVEERADSTKVRSKIQKEIDNQAQHLAEYKHIVGFEIWPEELPKTSTRKIKRKEVQQRVASGSK